MQHERRVTHLFQFVSSFMRLKLPLHLLFCNAGQMLSPFWYQTLATNGCERQFAANHLGHFHLVNRLLLTMEACSSSKRALGILARRSSCHNLSPNLPPPRCSQAASSNFSRPRHHLINPSEHALQPKRRAESSPPPLSHTGARWLTRARQ
jgi:NAD(P)-dependent dehydrogenase (short-subunit alcohol dehydrogenase family)